MNKIVIEYLDLYYTIDGKKFMNHGTQLNGQTILTELMTVFNLDEDSGFYLISEWRNKHSMSRGDFEIAYTYNPIMELIRTMPITQDPYLNNDN